MLHLPVEILEHILVCADRPLELSLASKTLLHLSRDGFVRARWVLRHTHKLGRALSMCRIPPTLAGFPVRVLDDSTCYALLGLLDDRQVTSNLMQLFILVWDHATSRGLQKAVRRFAALRSEQLLSWIDFGLCNCLKQGHYELSKFLLGMREDGWKKANTSLFCEATFHHGRGFLMEGCVSGNVQIVALLLDDSSSARVHDGALGEALEVAANLGHRAVVELLIERGASPHHLADAVIKYSALGDASLVEFFFKFSLAADIPSICLSAAAEQGHSAVVAVCITHGANVNFNDHEPVRHAVRHGHITVLRLLAAQNAHLHFQDSLPLRLACEVRHNTAIVAYLLACAADVHARNDEPLAKALAHGSTDVARLLLAHGADLDKVDRSLVRINLERLGINPTSQNRKRKHPRAGSTSFLKKKRPTEDAPGPGAPPPTRIDNLTAALCSLNLSVNPWM